MTYDKTEDAMREEFENLANAIILQAVKDWRQAVRVLKKRPRYRAAREMREDCEKFFLSECFEELTRVDGRALLEQLKREAGIDDG